MKGKLFFLFGFFLLGVVFWQIAGRVGNNPTSMHDSDFFTFWLGGRMVLNGETPYDEAQWVSSHARYGATWIPNNVYIYPLPLAVLSVPLGVLDVPLAAQVWIFLSLWLILASCMLLFFLAGQSIKLSILIPVLCGVFTFRPVLVTLINGQMGALWLATAVMSVWLWSRHRWLLGGMLLPIFMLKPSFGSVLFALVFLWLILSRRWSATFGVAISSLGLACLGWIIDPAWIMHFLEAGQNKLLSNFGYFPNLLGVLNSILKQDPVLAIVVFIIMSGLYFGLMFLYFSKRSHQLDGLDWFCLAVPSALLLSPYLWAYDQILLLVPILAATGYFYRLRYPYLFTATIPILMSVLSLILLGVAYRLGNDAWSILITVVSLGLASDAIRRSLAGSSTLVRS